MAKLVNCTRWLKNNQRVRLFTINKKLTNLSLMLETEYLERQNKLVSEVSRKLNYQVAIQNALADHESAHMIKWIEEEVQKELNQLDQNEQIQACVDHLKTL